LSARGPKSSVPTVVGWIVVGQRAEIIDADRAIVAGVAVAVAAQIGIQRGGIGAVVDAVVVVVGVTGIAASVTVGVRAVVGGIVVG
jgi:hypothetical protein